MRPGPNVARAGQWWHRLRSTFRLRGILWCSHYLSASKTARKWWLGTIRRGLCWSYRRKQRSVGAVDVRRPSLPNGLLGSRTDPWADVVLPGKASERAVADDVTSAMPELPTNLQPFELEARCPEELLHQECRTRAASSSADNRRNHQHHHQCKLQAAGGEGRASRERTKTHKGALPGSYSTPRWLMFEPELLGWARLPCFMF